MLYVTGLKIEKKIFKLHLPFGGDAGHNFATAREVLVARATMLAVLVAVPSPV